ncbi:hypothetical protein ACP70R_027081 [Stipagrostis hirtigluma subsp. patula]
MGKLAKIGQWGGNAGSARDVRATPDQLIQVKVTHGDGSCIRSISFSYRGADGKTYNVGPWGDPVGTEYKIDLCKCGESLKEISGTTGPAFNIDNLVKSLKFVTDKRTYGPYGDDDGIPFRVAVMNDGRIDAFFGRSGDCLDAIGLYVNPN